MEKDNILNTIKELYKIAGLRSYGEDITQLEHALQCYALAEESGWDVEMQIAAFLHDIGHLLVDNGDEAHDQLGADQLLNWGFSQRIAEIIRGHVWAKRYLTATESNYIESLSLASLKSLGMQGGPMDEEEIEVAEQHPWFHECITLRRWDDIGKKMDNPNQIIPEIIWQKMEQLIYS